MATKSANRNAVPGPASLVPVSNKLQDRMNALREVIDRHKREVLRVSGEMKQLIEDRAQLVIRELEGIWDQANTRVKNKGEEVNIKIKEINKRKKEMEIIFKDLSPTLSLSPFGEIDKAMNSVRREMDIDIPYVKLSWRASELRESIQRLFTWEQLNVTYREDTNVRVKWGTCGKGKGDEELWDPWGVAIDSMKSRILVADRDAHRIQIFSINGDWVQSLKDEQMNHPDNINFILNSVFVQCRKTIVKFNRTSLARESHKSYTNYLSGICTDITSVYVSTERMELIVLTHGLIEERRVPLPTQYRRGDTRVKGISLAIEEFYVLLSGSEYPIQSFSKQGTPNRCIIHRKLLSENVWHFCLDQQLNILVADNGSNKVKIFSKEGKMITQFGQEGSEKAEFIGLRGIAVDDSSNITTTDSKENYKLQTFSPE